ncbi:MAG: glycerol-3-phosphate 1-O-acyltransferase [Alphaproteobacteria bacterium]|nr:glycerol-3-phosphate 1-O-acyltransferase [Alphaproteobacteria bacterium]
MNKIVDAQVSGAPLPQWPAPPGARVLFLTESRTATERQVLERWIETTRPKETSAEAVSFLGLPSTADELQAFGNHLAPHLTDGSVLLAPLRIAWLPREQGGERAARLSDLIMLRDPRRPREAEQKRVVQVEPERCRVVAGQPASIAQLSERAKQAGDADAGDAHAFAEFVSRQATLALERAEYRLIGRRYKLPRLVREQIVASRRFRDGVAEVARKLKRSDASVTKEALVYLHELRTAHSPFAIDMMMQLARSLFSRGYGTQIDYDQAQIERTRMALERAPGIILPSHKSNLDSAVTSVAFADNRLATPTTFGGINMAFWPMGTVARKAGRVFIRRDVRNNPVYKFVLREYLGYLVEKRFSLEWYIEGGRSRTGKLLPPKLGLLTYLVSAYREGRVDDLMLMPISIAYDQLHEVSEFAAEAQGGKKKAENLAWFVRFFRAQRSPFGRIYFRVAEPVSMREMLGPPDGGKSEGDEETLATQKVAFEVSWRINDVTPITGTSLVALVLLAQRGRALTLEQTREELDDYLTSATRRRLPLAPSARLPDIEATRRILDALAQHQVVSVHKGGLQTVFSIGTDQHMAAAFYRNTIVHFFVNAAIAELALLKAAEQPFEEREAAFWDEALRLRDILKFEFFFKDKNEFRASLDAELKLQSPDWRETLARGRESTLALLKGFRPLSAHSVLRSFFEAYVVVADTLAVVDPGIVDEKKLLVDCAAVGRQYMLQKRIQSAESVSKHLFQTGLQLARNQKLLEATDDVAGRRRAFAASLGDVMRRIDTIEALTHERAREQTLV